MKIKEIFIALTVILILSIAPGTASAVIGGTTIGGCIYTGDGTATYTAVGATIKRTWDTKYKEDGTPPITDAMVMVQNQHSGGKHVTYGTMGLGASGNCWEADIDTNGDGIPEATDVIAMFAAPGHAITSREWTWDPDGRFDPSNHGVLPSLTAPHWPGGTTINQFIHPTGLHPKAGGKADPITGEALNESVWALGPQDAYLMTYPQKTTSALHYVFYDNFTDGNDNGPIQDPPINGVTVRVFNEDGEVVATQVTGFLATPAGGGGFITDDGVVYAGTAAYGYAYFTGLPGDDEYKVEVDPSTVTQAANPHYTFSLPDVAGASCTGADGHYDYEKPNCKWYQTYTEEGTHAGEYYAWPGSPGTMGGGYLKWHALVEKLPSDLDQGNPNPSPLLGTIRGTLLDSTGSDPLEAPTAAHGGRVPPTNARFENGVAWNRTRSEANWGGTTGTVPPSDVIPNSRIMDGRVVLYSLGGAQPKVVATAVATNPIDVNDPANGGRFEFTHVPPGNYGIYGMDRDLNYVMFTGPNIILPVGGIVDIPMLYERWGARTMGFVQRTRLNGSTVAGVGLEVKKWYKAGTTKFTTTTNGKGWFFDPMWWETGQMGVQYVNPTDGADWRGKIVTEQFQDLPTIIEPPDTKYNWVTHNSMSRSVGYATHNYFVDLQIEDIPLNVGNLIGAVFNDHFSNKLDPALHNKGNGVYDESEDRLWQGNTVELYAAPTGIRSTCATLARQPWVLPVKTVKTGKFSKSDASKMGWNRPYSYPADEIGSMHASPVLFFGTTGINVPAIPPVDYLASDPGLPNIGTSASETARFISHSKYAPAPGLYEFRDLEPGDYCVRTIPPKGFRRSPDSDVEPGGFRAVTVTGGLNSRVDLGINTTPTSYGGTCNIVRPTITSRRRRRRRRTLAVAPVTGTCSNNANYSCQTDVDCDGIAHPFGIRMAGEVEGGVWDGMQAVDSNPLSLLFMDAIALMGAPVEIKDGNDYFIGVGYQGDTRCHSVNNLVHTPGTSMLDPLDPLYDPFACRSTINLKSKPELERRFPPGANRYRGNAFGYLWNRVDPSVPTYWDNYTTMELGIGVPQAGYKFEAAWTPTLKQGTLGQVFPICAIDMATFSFTSTPWGASVTVTVEDGWAPVEAADVFGTWSTGNQQSCTTDINGQCTMTLNNVNPGDTEVTFSINNIVPNQQIWYVYNPDPTSPPLDPAHQLLGGVCVGSVVVGDPGLPTPPPALAQCEDGLDNDGDTLTDAADPGCLSGPGGTYNPLDNNEYTNPPPPPPPSFACSDGIDNDGDGLIDFGTGPENDPGCVSIFDTTEEDPPIGGPVSVHVISMTGTAAIVQNLIADVTVILEDNMLNPAGGITADFSYTWDKEGVPTTNTMSCITDVTGACTATTQAMQNVILVSVTFVGITDPAIIYAPADNTAATTIIVTP